MSTSETSLSKKIQSPTLTKNQKIVLDLLENSSEPLKAYSILASLQKEGLKSPLQVYRALDKLVELGKSIKLKAKIPLLFAITRIVQILAILYLPFVKNVKMSERLKMPNFSRALAN